MGAICDLLPPWEGYYNFSVSEFVTLDDGRRVTLHNFRQVSIGGAPSSESRSGEVDFDHPHSITAEELTRGVLRLVLGDKRHCTEAGCTGGHDLSFLVALARAQGVGVGAEDLQRLPYEVILTERLRRWLAQT